MKDSSLRAKWQARMDNERQRMTDLGIFDRPCDYSDFEVGFPHNGMPIFTRNERIRQDSNSRERKRRVEAEQDRKTLSQLDRRRTALVAEYDCSTQEAQRLQTQYQRTENQPATQCSVASKVLSSK